MEKKPRLSQVVQQYPELIPPEEQDEITLQILRLRQRLEQNTYGREKIAICVPDQDPIMLIALNDTHIGAVSTDYDAIDEIVNLGLDNDDVFYLGVGDYVESITEKYLSTNVTRTPLDLQQQIELFRHHILEPLAEQGKVLAMVGDYGGHEGWIFDKTTLNPWKVLTQGLDVPLLRNNGSQLEVQLADGEVVTWETYHAPPGTSRNDPVHGLREAVFATSESQRADIYVSGHTHQMGIAKENYVGAKKPVTLIQSGAFKGSADKEVPDIFGIHISRKRSNRAGQGVVVKSRENQRPLILPFPTIQHGEALNVMTEFYNQLEQQHMTAEIYEKIRAEIEQRPDIRFVQNASSLVLEPHDETPSEKRPKGEQDDEPKVNYKLAQQYNSLGFHIVTSLPKILTPISKVRLGAATEGGKDLRKFLEDFGHNPDFLFVFLGDMLDKDVPSSPDREKTLKRYANLVNSTDGNTLAIMFDGIMRHNRWKSPIKKYGTGLPAATWMSEHTNTKLISNLGNISMAIGPEGARMMDKPTYTGVYADHLKGQGSQSKPTYGLSMLYKRNLHEKPGMVIGGHMPNSGYSIREDTTNAETDYPVFIAPGSFARQDVSAGKSNVSGVANYGQGAILMPGMNKDDYMVLAIANLDDLKYLAPASVLYTGSQLLGITDQLMGR